MNRTHALALSLALLLSGFAFAQQQTPSMTQPQMQATPQPAANANPDQDRTQILALVQQLDQAAIQNDTSFFDRVLAPNYQAVNAQGVKEDKGDILKAHRNDDIKYESVQERDQDIQVNGDSAVERATTDVRGVYKGQRFDGTYASTRNFQRMPDGSWQIVNFEVHQVK